MAEIAKTLVENDSSLLLPEKNDKFLNEIQASYPNVRVQILIAERYVDHIGDGVDIVFRLGALKDSSLVARRILTFRHQLVVSPDYLKSCKPPETPTDLLGHRLIAFSYWRPESRWTFVHSNGKHEETLSPNRIYR
jgi:DNA-binding transcriptional LysR family regulator